jgi:hypothetical protein
LLAFNIRLPQNESAEIIVQSSMSCDDRIKLLKFRLGECIVDDVAVAEDTQESLDVQGVGLYIGAGKSTGAGTY